MHEEDTSMSEVEDMIPMLSPIVLDRESGFYHLKAAYNRLGNEGVTGIIPHSLNRIVIITANKYYDAYLDYTKAYSMTPDLIDTPSTSAFRNRTLNYEEFRKCLYYITCYKAAAENKITQIDKENLIRQFKYCLAHNYIKSYTFDNVTNITAGDIIPRVEDATISHLILLYKSPITEDWKSEVIKIIPWLSKLDSCYIAAFELLCIKHSRRIELFGNGYFSKYTVEESSYLIMNPDGLDDASYFCLKDNEIDLDSIMYKQDNLAIVTWLSGVKSALAEIEVFFESASFTGSGLLTEDLVFLTSMPEYFYANKL